MMQQSGPDVGYDKTSDYEWTVRAYELLLAGQLTVRVLTGDAVSSALVQGPCPRCAHHMTDRRLLTAVTALLGDHRTGGHQGYPGLQYTDTPSPQALVLDVTCSCGAPHADRDGKAEAAGCGASFRIELAPAALLDPTSAEADPDPNPVDPATGQP